MSRGLKNKKFSGMRAEIIVLTFMRNAHGFASLFGRPVAFPDELSHSSSLNTITSCSSLIARRKIVPFSLFLVSLPSPLRFHNRTWVILKCALEILTLNEYLKRAKPLLLWSQCLREKRSWGLSTRLENSRLALKQDWDLCNSSLFQNQSENLLFDVVVLTWLFRFF